MAERRNLLTITLEMLTRSIADAEERQTCAQIALTSFEENAKRAAKSATRPAGRTDAQRPELDKLASDGRWREDAAVAAVLLRHGRLSRAQIAVLRAARQRAAQGATQRLVSLRERYDEARAEARDLEITLGRLQALFEESDSLRKQIALLDRRCMELEVQFRSDDLGRGQGGPVIVAAPAGTPRSSSHPRIGDATGKGALVGLVLGVIAAIIFRRRRAPEARLQA